ncbi:hypothetical protein JCM8097_003838 [Rhodosporidiobolus ruineniae]
MDNPLDPVDYNFDLDYYCPVCDRAIDPNTALTSECAPAPPPTLASAPTPSPSLASAAPSTSSSSKASSKHGPDAPRMRRSASGASSSSAHHHPPSHSKAPLKRNKSWGRLHHGPHGAGARYHRTHSHTALHALAPLAPAGGEKAAAKKAAGGGGKAAKVKEEIIEVIETDPPSDEGGMSGHGMYCSDECRRIDEARNALQLAHLTGQPLTTSPEVELLQRSHSHVELPSASVPPPFDAMSRRRSSGLSAASSTGSGSTASYGFSSVGVLSPIFSAAPTANPDAAASSGQTSFPFPAQPPPPARSASAASSLPSHLARPPPSVAHASGSLPPPLAGSSAHNPPFLNFAARRKSRGAEHAGSYAYRPSLTDRGMSSDALYTLGGAASSAAGAGGAAGLGMGERSLSLTDAAGAARLSAANRSASVDHLAGLAAQDAMGERARPPSALSGFRSMTPLSGTSSQNPSLSPARPRSTLSRSSTSSLPSSRRDESRERGARRPRFSEESLQEDEAEREERNEGRGSRFFVGSAPTRVGSAMGLGRRQRGPSFGEPSVAEASSLQPSTSPTLSRPIGLHPRHRPASSASLALMGTSLGRSYDAAPRPWGGPRRSESVASLSGFVALGEIASPSPSATPMPPVSTSAASTGIPATSSSYRAPPPSHAYSPTSSDAPSTSSTGFSALSRSRSRGSSTDLTSHYNPILSTSAVSSRSSSSGYRGGSSGAGGASSGPAGQAGAGSAMKRTGSISRSRKGLLMTPSASGSNLAAIGGAAPSSGASLLPPPLPSLHTSSSSAAPTLSFVTPANAASTNPAFSYLKTEPSAPSPPPPLAPPSLASHARTLSHDRLVSPVLAEPPKYPVYDVEAFRRASGSSRSGSGSARPGRATSEPEAEGQMLPPPVPQRKRLFYFSQEE